MRSRARAPFARLVRVLPLPNGSSGQTVYECKRCGATLESREDECEYCGTSRVAVYRIE